MKKRKKARSTVYMKKTLDSTASDDNRDTPSDIPLHPEACPYCFLHPCVATTNSSIADPGQAPHDENNGIRKRIYQRYWKIIQNLEGWNIPQYITKKIGAAGRAAVNHQREIMPACVLKLVRSKYPNLPGVPYMDHLWI